MSKNVEVQKEAPAVLPDINRKALWHEKAGLVVSLNNCPLPNPSTTSCHQPEFFDDLEIWRAFYARNMAFHAPVFGRLDYTGPQILEKVIQLDPNTYSLPDTIISEWSQQLKMHSWMLLIIALAPIQNLPRFPPSLGLATHMSTGIGGPIDLLLLSFAQQ